MKTPTEFDWNKLIELKSYANRDSESARLYNEFVEGFNWNDYKYEAHGKVGLKNIFGKIIIPATFDDILTTQNAHQGYLYPAAVVKLNEKYSLALRDGTGRTLCPFIYDEIKQLDSENYCTYKDGKYGVLNNKGRCIFPCVFDDVDTDIFNLPLDVTAVMTKGNKFGFVLSYTKFGYLETPLFRHEYINPIFEDWRGQEFDHRLGTFTGDLKVKKDGSWGYLDNNAQFSEVAGDAYIGSEFQINETQKKLNSYYRNKWWEEHPDEDRSIYYMDETNFN